jgi:hypothetical protein
MPAAWEAPYITMTCCAPFFRASNSGFAAPYSQIRGNTRRDTVRSGMRKFESSHSSQAVYQPEIVLAYIAERPANCGLLQIGAPSLSSKFQQSYGEIADSLQPTFEIFPFSGDSCRRPGAISTAWCGTQSDEVIGGDRMRRRDVVLGAVSLIASRDAALAWTIGEDKIGYLHPRTVALIRRP